MLAAARDTDAWNARDDTDRRAAAERAPARSDRGARTRRASSSRKFAAIGATGVNVRFVHHSPAHYREQLAALAALTAC